MAPDFGLSAFLASSTPGNCRRWPELDNEHDDENENDLESETRRKSQSNTLFTDTDTDTDNSLSRCPNHQRGSVVAPACLQ
jgi:hypothetical protein